MSELTALDPAAGVRTYELDRAHVFHSWSAQALITPMVVAGDALGTYDAPTAAVGVGAVFLLRMVALRRRWSAPLPRGVDTT